MVKMVSLLAKSMLFAFVEVPAKAIIRAVVLGLFLLDAFLIFAPCMVVEVLFFRHDTIFHKVAKWVEVISDRLVEVSDLFDRYV